MRVMFRLVYNFIFRTERRGLTVKALFWVTISRLRIRFVSSNKLHNYLGEKGKSTPEDVEFTSQERKHIRWVMEKTARVANRLPWENKCLVRAMVAQRLLREYGLASTLYLGVGRDEEKNMAAHAWVRCGPYYVTGGDGKDYATVAFFSMDPSGSMEVE